MEITDTYFKSYEELNVHRLMLNDKPRTLAYKNAILNSKHLFENKIVMDVGAGTGILSVFCAQAGAKLIYAIEASQLANITEEVALENNFQDRIKVIHNKVEDLSLECIEKVDVIVSEWMGFYLLHEGMLDSILFARDKFLKENGSLFPSIAKLYASPCQLPQMYEFWDNVCGVDMKCVGKEFRRAKSKNPEILLVNESDLLTDGRMMAWFDLAQITMDELNHLGYQEYVTVCNKGGRFQGICIWFAVEFPDTSELSTGPMDKETHWKQTVIVLPTDTTVVKDEPIAFKLEFKRDAVNARQYKIHLELLDALEVDHDIPCSCHYTKCIVTRTYLKERINNPRDK